MRKGLKEQQLLMAAGLINAAHEMAVAKLSNRELADSYEAVGWCERTPQFGGVSPTGWLWVVM